MQLWDAIVLGIVQGLTEFLPVSSSGHLVLARDLLGMAPSKTPVFEVIVHLGTLASILVVMRKECWALVTAVPNLLKPKTWRESFANDMGFRHLALLIPATIPTVIVGLVFKDQIDSAFGAPKIAAGMFLVTAALLWLSRKPAKFEGRKIAAKHAWLMGIAQAVAIIPGISRSGSTISAGLMSGLSRESAGSFAFLMAIPAICGAAILESKDMVAAEFSADIVVAGLLSSFLTGTLALLLLLKLVKSGRLWIFSGYLVMVAVTYLVLTINI